MEENIRVSSSVVSHAGDKSQPKEDSFFVNGKFMYHRKDSDIQVSVESSQDLQVYAVCKGMGASTDGKRTSVSVNNELKRFLEKNIDGRETMEGLFNKLCELVDEATSLINSTSEMDFEESRLPVLAGLLVKGGEAGVLSLGNTRIYRLRNGSLRQLTADHRRTERLLRLGIITDEQAEAVSSRLGDADDELSRVKRTEVFELNKGDIYVLSSSEDLDYLDEDALLYILAMDEDTSVIAGTLMDEVSKRYPDNDMTIQVIKVEELAAALSSPKAAAATIGTTGRYTPRRPVKTTRSGLSRAKIKRVIRMFTATIVLFSIVIGLFWLIEKLLFPRDDRQASDITDNTTTITSTTTGDETSGESERETEPVETEPGETTETSDQGSTSTSVTEPGERTYVVKSGDTLMSIARQFYNDASKYVLIQNANNLPNPDHIVVGQELIIPYLD